MRAVGEVHISSVAFREGIIGPGGDFDLWPQSGPAMAAVADDRHHIGPDDAVTVHRQPDSAISNTVLFPVTEAQRNGLEDLRLRSEEHTSELQSLMRISYAVFCLKKKNK